MAGHLQKARQPRKTQSWHHQSRSRIRIDVRRPSRVMLFFSAVPVFGTAGASACIPSATAPTVPQWFRAPLKTPRPFHGISQKAQPHRPSSAAARNRRAGSGGCPSIHHVKLSSKPRSLVLTLSPRLGTGAASTMPPHSTAPYWRRRMSVGPTPTTLTIDGRMAPNVRRHGYAAFSVL